MARNPTGSCSQILQILNSCLPYVLLKASNYIHKHRWLNSLLHTLPKGMFIRGLKKSKDQGPYSSADWHGTQELRLSLGRTWRACTQQHSAALMHPDCRAQTPEAAEHWEQTSANFLLRSFICLFLKTEAVALVPSTPQCPVASLHAFACIYLSSLSVNYSDTLLFQEAFWNKNKLKK